MQVAKERYYRDPQSGRHYQQRQHEENPEQEKVYEKKKITKIGSHKNDMKKNKYEENPEPKKIQKDV